MTFTAVACLDVGFEDRAERSDEYFDRPLDEADPLFVLGEVALWLRVTTDTLARWRRKGDGPEYVTLQSGAIRYRNSKLQAWVDGRVNCVLPAAPRPVREGSISLAA